MKLLALSILTLGILFSCASSKNAQEATGTEQSQNTSTDEISFKNLSDSDSLFASVIRGACFGSCSIYELNIYNDGTATLFGKANVKYIGHYITTLRKEDMLEFIEVAKEIGYMDMDDEYDNPYISDIPAVYSSIVIDGQRKKIKRRVGFPKSILRYEELFEQLIETKTWIQDRGH